MMTDSILVWRELEELKHTLRDMRREDAGMRLGLVPTMGALHAGHMALIDAAKKYCDKIVVSIFVNPKQFCEGEDFEKYPRDFGKDYDILAKNGVDILFLPHVNHIYPDGFCTNVEVAGLSDVLCGAVRKGHFDGVATIVTILLGVVQPDYSFFGEKDAQQLLIIRRLHKDLHLSGEIISVPTVREKDGLAMSSRNSYLSEEQRHIAPILYKTICDMKETIINEETNIRELIESSKKRILSAGFDAIDYLEIREENNLHLVESADDMAINHARIFVAARIGEARLIDNIKL